MSTAPLPGHGTEYSENYVWTPRHKTGGVGKWSPRGSADQTRAARQGQCSRQPPCVPNLQYMTLVDLQRDTSKFPSLTYPSVYRELSVRKDEKGHYIDPFKNLVSKPSGRRLLYDQTHPDKMYGSQWSSELADIPGPYSFPTTTELDAEIPWCKDLQWQWDGEVGEWPTPLWKEWTSVAMCPPYHGHDDQVEYSKYKVQV